MAYYELQIPSPPPLKLTPKEFSLQFCGRFEKKKKKKLDKEDEKWFQHQHNTTNFWLPDVWNDFSNIFHNLPEKEAKRMLGELSSASNGNLFPG